MAYRKTAATEARKDARRKLILGTATRLFGSYGYHAATVPMIAAEANSSVGSFYAHFRNKEDVSAATLETLGEKISELIFQTRDSQPDPLLGIRCAVGSVFLYLPRRKRAKRLRSRSSRQVPGCARNVESQSGPSFNSATCSGCERIQQ